MKEKIDGMEGRRVFISFLGTTNYIRTPYRLAEETSAAVRFVQQALIGLLCKEWTEKDCVMIFYTKASKDKNWVDGGHDITSSEPGLESVLKKMNFPMQIEHYEIPDGFSETEIWAIFDTVYGKLKEEDRIYLDVTHAFRSIPLFSVVLFNYVHFMKSTQLVSIYYGAFEASRGLGITPVIDLTSLVDLQITNVAASNFIEFGKVGTIAAQLEAESSVINKTGIAIRTLKEELARLDEYIATCDMKGIREGVYIQKIDQSFKSAMNWDKLQLSEKLLLRKIKENLNDFSPKGGDKNVEAAIQWALKYEMVQQAYTLGEEFIITKTRELIKKKLNSDLSDYDIDFMCHNNGQIDKRKFLRFAGGVMGMPEGKEYDGGEAERKLARILVSQSWMKDLKKEYNVLRENRNGLNHAKGGKKISALKEDFYVKYGRCMEIIHRELMLYTGE